MTDIFFYNTLEDFINVLSETDRRWVKLTLDSRGTWSSIFYFCKEFKYIDTLFILEYKDMIFKLDEEIMNIAHHSLAIWQRNPIGSLFGMMNAFFDADAQLPGWRTYGKTKTIDCGQAKILTGALEVFADYDKPEVKLCVAGSAGVTVSGTTYTTLATILSEHNLSGSMDLYDPAEENGVSYVGNFKIARHSEIYDYDTVENYDVLLDDAYDVADIVDTVDVCEGVCSVQEHAPDGTYKFVIARQKHGKIKHNVMFLEKEASHSSLKIIGEPLGGGKISYYNGYPVLTSNTSGTYGDVSIPDVRKFFPKITVKYKGRTQSFERLFDNKRTRMSLKWFGDQHWGGDERKQVFYEGYETRLLLNCPKYVATNMTFHGSDGCNNCKRVASAVMRLPPGGDPNRDFLRVFSLNGATCKPVVGITHMTAQSLLLKYASQHALVDDAVANIAGYLNVTVTKVKADLDMFLKVSNFTIVNRGTRIARFESKFGVPKEFFSPYFPQWITRLTPCYGKMTAEAEKLVSTYMRSAPVPVKQKEYVITSEFEMISPIIVLMFPTAQLIDYYERYDYVRVYTGENYRVYVNWEVERRIPNDYRIGLYHKNGSERFPRKRK